jgi:thiol-disulfide isomerase/thioredoxin
MRPRLPLLRALVCASVLVLSLGAAASQGAEAGALALEDLDGKPVELSLDAGEAALLVHFWATWCPSCVEELSVLDAAARRCGAQVRVVAVNVAEDAEKIRRFVSEHALELRQLRDVRGDVWRRLSGRGLPVNLIWTPRGRRLEQGPREAKRWKQILEEIGCG